MLWTSWSGLTQRRIVYSPGPASVTQRGTVQNVLWTWWPDLTQRGIVQSAVDTVVRPQSGTAQNVSRTLVVRPDPERNSTEFCGHSGPA